MMIMMIMMTATKTILLLMITCILTTPSQTLGCSDPVSMARNHREVAADETSLMITKINTTVTLATSLAFFLGKLHANAKILIIFITIIIINSS